MVDIQRFDGAVGAHFVCGRCGFSTGALVQCTGITQGGPFADPRANARGAFHAALRHASETLHFVPCPACGWRNTSERKRIRNRFLLLVVGVPFALFVPATAYAFWGLRLDQQLEALPYVCGLLALVVAVVYVIFPKPWSNAAERVRFTSTL